MNGGCKCRCKHKSNVKSIWDLYLVMKTNLIKKGKDFKSIYFVYLLKLLNNITGGEMRLSLFILAAVFCSGIGILRQFLG